MLLPPHWPTAAVLLGAWSAGLAERLDLHAGDRVLVHAGEHEHPVKWLLAPLAVGATVVLCANLNPAGVAARAAAEDVTRILQMSMLRHRRA